MILRLKKDVALIRRTLGVLVCGSVIVGPVMAQQQDANQGTDQDAQKVQRVVITGSNLSRIDAEGPTAVQVITRDQIDKSGAATTDELLGTLTSVAVLQDSTNGNAASIGASAVAMRGLDSKYVLILLNGRRVANYGYAEGTESSFVDLNNIPLAAIESVEILRDGASAIYGSDAVAGVINFKTRQNYQGLEATANTSSTLKGDGTTLSASITGGWGDMIKDGQNLLVTFDTLQRHPLESDKHTYTMSNDFTQFGGPNRQNPSLFPGTLIDANTGQTFAIPGCQGAVAKNPNGLGGTICYTNPNTLLTPTIDRSGLSGVYNKRLENGELFVELGINHNVTTYQQGYPTFDPNFVGMTAGSTNPGLALLPGPSATLPGFTPGDPLNVERSIYEAGQRVETVASNTDRFVLGWRGMLGKWDSESAVALNQNRIHDVIDNQVLLAASSASLQSGLMGGPGYNPFLLNNPMNVLSQFLTDTTRNATSKLSSIDWKMSNNELSTLGSGPVGFAWGAQASRESVADRPDPLIAADQIVGQGSTSTRDGRSIYSIYGEINLKPINTVEVQLALRGDHYSDAGNSLNPKLAIAWRPMQSVLLRGSATTSFKAPTLPEEAMSSRAYVGVQDNAVCGPLHISPAACYQYVPAYAVGNPDLKPEKADNYSIGLVLQPTKNLVASLDWYGIHQRDTINVLDEQYILDHENSIPGYSAYVTRAPLNPALAANFPGLTEGFLTSLTLPFINVGETISEGIDLDVKYLVPLGSYGALNFHESNTIMTAFDQSIVPGAAPTGRLGGTNWPRWNNSLTTSYLFDKKELALTARTYASTWNIPDPTLQQPASITNARLPSYTIWNLNFTMSPAKDWTLNAGANNVFNRTPVFSNSIYEESYIQATNMIVGPIVYLNLRYKFK